MSEKVRMPADLDQVSLKLLGKFNAKDLARLTLPITAAFIYTQPTTNPSPTAFISILLAAAIGATWAVWKPWNRPLDQNLYHSLRWLTTTQPSTPQTENRYITVDGSTTALIKIEPVNLQLKSGNEKAALHKQLQELLNTVDYTLEIHSTQKPATFNTYLNNLTASDPVQADHRNHCKELAKQGQSRTKHFIAIRIKDGDIEELENRVNEVLEQLNSGAISAHQITEVDQNQILPETKRGHLVNQKSRQKHCSKTLYISEYPQELGFSWTTDLLQVDGLIDITQSITPKNPAETVSRLHKLENKAEAENRSLIRKGYGSSRKLERLLNDIDWFQNLLADQNDQPVKYGVYITAYGENKESCEETLRQIKNRLTTLGIQYQDTVLRTDQVLHSTTPGYSDKLNERLLLPAGSAASGFPFTLPSTIDSKGVLIGTSQSTESPVILNRFQWNAGHQILAGVTGSGKSFHSKLLLLRSSQIYDNLHIHIVDPKPEYSQLEPALNRYASVTRHTSESGISEDTERLVQAVEDAYQDAQKHPGKSIVVVDEAHRLLKEEKGASILSTLVREARSSNTAVTLITQTITDFTRTEDGQDILKNTPCKILFAHEQTDNQPTQAFNLSKNAETSLYNLARGDNNTTDYSEAILTVSNQHESRIKIEATETEKQLIENNEPTEKTSTPEPTKSTQKSSKQHSQQHEIPEDEKAVTTLIREKLPSLKLPSLPTSNTSTTPDDTGTDPLAPNTGQENSPTNTQNSNLREKTVEHLHPIYSGAKTGVILSLPPATSTYILDLLIFQRDEVLIEIFIGACLTEAALLLLLWYKSNNSSQPQTEASQ